MRNKQNETLSNNRDIRKHESQQKKKKPKTKREQKKSMLFFVPLYMCLVPQHTTYHLIWQVRKCSLRYLQKQRGS